MRLGSVQVKVVYIFVHGIFVIIMITVASLCDNKLHTTDDWAVIQERKLWYNSNHQTPYLASLEMEGLRDSRWSLLAHSLDKSRRASKHKTWNSSKYSLFDNEVSPPAVFAPHVDHGVVNHFPSSHHNYVTSPTASVPPKCSNCSV